MSPRAALIWGCVVAALVPAPALAVLGYTDPPNSGWAEFRWTMSLDLASRRLNTSDVREAPDASFSGIVIPSRAVETDYRWEDLNVRAVLYFAPQRGLWKVELRPRRPSSCAQLEGAVARTRDAISQSPEGRSPNVREQMRAFRGSSLAFKRFSNGDRADCVVEIASNRILSKGL